MVYGESRLLAAARMAREAAGHTLQPTALVHEAWMGRIGDDNRWWENRGIFFGAASEAMRRILVGSARRKARLKHRGGQMRIDADGLEIVKSLPDEHFHTLAV